MRTRPSKEKKYKKLIKIFCINTSSQYGTTTHNTRKVEDEVNSFLDLIEESKKRQLHRVVYSGIYICGVFNPSRVEL